MGIAYLHSVDLVQADEGVGEGGRRLSVSEPEITTAARFRSEIIVILDIGDCEADLSYKAVKLWSQSHAIFAIISSQQFTLSPLYSPYQSY